MEHDDHLSGRNNGVLESAIEAIGWTPCVNLSRITTIEETYTENGEIKTVKKSLGTILAKLEYLNPGHSKKDRIARQIIEDAESQGILKPGQSVIELTSGNTGTGLAIVCAVKKYPFIAVMSKGNSIERAKMMQALGAEVVLVDQHKDSVPGQVSGQDIQLVEEETQKLTKAKNVFRADQFNTKANYRAHFLHTAHEVLEQTKLSGYQVDAFCDFVGSGGTFGGCAAKFKEYNPNIKCYVVEPKAILRGSGVQNSGHRIQGGGYSMTHDQLPMLHIKDDIIDGYLIVTDEEVIETCRRLAREEGIFAGFSSGANVCAALKLLHTKELAGKTIVVCLCDSGMILQSITKIQA